MTGLLKNVVAQASVATSYFFESTVLFFHNIKILYFFCTFFRPCTFFVLFFHQFGWVLPNSFQKYCFCTFSGDFAKLMFCLFIIYNVFFINTP